MDRSEVTLHLQFQSGSRLYFRLTNIGKLSEVVTSVSVGQDRFSIKPEGAKLQSE